MVRTVVAAPPIVFDQQLYRRKKMNASNIPQVAITLTGFSM